MIEKCWKITMEQQWLMAFQWLSLTDEPNLVLIFAGSIFLNAKTYKWLNHN